MQDSNTHPEVAHRGSFRNLKSLPEQRTQLNFDMELSAEEYNRLILGHISLGMDDKWDAFFESSWLHLHRSWTGVCVYQIRIEPVENSYVTVEAWVNRDQDQYKQRNDRYDEALLFFLIGNLLLGKQISFPLPNNLSPNVPEGVFQHSVAGSGYPEVVLPDDRKA